MTNRSALALAFATGYVAGRSRIKIPLGMGGALLARRLGVDPGRIGEQFKERTPQLAEATGRLRNNVRQAGRAATGALPTERLESLTGGVRGQLGRAPWKSGGRDGSEPAGSGSEDSRASEPSNASGDSDGSDAREKREEKSGKDANGSRGNGGSRGESAGSGKSEGNGRAASRRAPAKKTASRTAGKTASASRKPAGAAKKATGSAGKQTGKSSGNTRKTTGTAKRTGGSERG
ncbi:hypothetical protein [Streptomyces mangrovi]|uniref:hypothetical protein n=1 Tax=Streptomyces mangrovi TaxID=1206892 RepID=UPI00399C9246